MREGVLAAAGVAFLTAAIGLSAAPAQAASTFRPRPLHGSAQKARRWPGNAAGFPARPLPRQHNFRRTRHADTIKLPPQKRGGGGGGYWAPAPSDLRRSHTLRRSLGASRDLSEPADQGDR